MEKYGVLHEIGDMGLGFDPLSEKDNKTLNEQVQKEASNKEKTDDK